MSAFAKHIVLKLLIQICLIWMWDRKTNDSPMVALGGWSTWFIYPSDLEMNFDELSGKRVKITFWLEDWGPRA